MLVEAASIRENLNRRFVLPFICGDVEFNISAAILRPLSMLVFSNKSLAKTIDSFC